MLHITNGDAAAGPIQSLETLAGGPRTLVELFPAAHHAHEAPFFMGDALVFEIVRELAVEDTPLVVIDAGDLASITAAGRDALAGPVDRVEALGLDRWRGGVHLTGRQVPFRSDSRARRIVAS